MLFITLLLSLIIYSQPIEYMTENNTGKGFDFFALGDSNVVMSYYKGVYYRDSNPFTFRNHICMSFNKGKETELITSYSALSNFNLSEKGNIFYQDKKFIFPFRSNLNGKLYEFVRYNLKGEVLDTININFKPSDYTYVPEIIDIKNNENFACILFKYTKKQENKSDFSLAISNDGYSNYQYIDIPKIENESFNILSLNIVDNYIYFIQAFNLDTLINDKVVEIGYTAIVKYDIEKQTFSNIYQTRMNEKYFLGVFPVKKDALLIFTLDKELYLFENNNLKFIKQLPDYFNVDLINNKLIDNNYLVLIFYHHIYLYDIKSGELKSKVIDKNEFPIFEEGSYGIQHTSKIEYSKSSNSILYNYSFNLLLEIYIDDFFFSSVEDIAIDFNPKIYPLPAEVNSIVNLELNKIANKIELYDIKGKIHKVVNEKSKNYTISTNNLSPGIYFVKIYFNGISLTKNLIIN